MAGRGLLRRGARARLLVVGLLAVLVLVSGCSWVSGLFGSSTPTETSTPVSVFEVAIGQCFNPPTGPPTVELSDLTSVSCTAPHTQESYASPTYKAPAGGDDSIYPGDAALVAFAKGSCAQSFTPYVGVSYLDSSLFFTYLLPSARSWEQGKDRTVLCFVTTTGKPLTATVKGSKL
ncbi:hypothetical protein ABIB25_001476 [Nakamurella sp. UYEF19]|uniref:septum formation family protein n=1 Tax=Nakamurella sp. UYEF19 TaxID=1756392 RepID=UPI003396E51E